MFSYDKLTYLMQLTSLHAIKSSHEGSSTNFHSFTRKAGTLDELDSKVCIVLGIEENDNINFISKIIHILQQLHNYM